MALVKKIGYVLATNFSVAFMGLLTVFIIPRYLNVEEYGFFKLFTFYSSYVVMLTLGYTDGLAVLIVQEKNDKNGDRHIQDTLLVSILISIVMSIGLLVLGVLTGSDSLVYALSIYLPISHLLYFFLNYYIAKGHIKNYSITRFFIQLITIVAHLVIIFLVGGYVSLYFISSIVICNLLVLSVMVVKHWKMFLKLDFNPRAYFKIVRVGLPILLATQGLLILNSLDRWFIGSFYGVEDFAHYSFAVSAMNILYLVVQGFSVVFFKYLSEVGNRNDATVEPLIYILTCACLPLFYIVKQIIIAFLPAYAASISILQILFYGLPYLAMINVIFINKLKMNQKGDTLLWITAKYIIIGLVLNFAVLRFLRKPVYFALASHFVIVLMFLALFKATYSKKLPYRDLSFVIVNIAANYFAGLELGQAYSLPFLLFFSIIISHIYYRNEIKSFLAVLGLRSQFPFSDGPAIT